MEFPGASMEHVAQTVLALGTGKSDLPFVSAPLAAPDSA